MTTKRKSETTTAKRSSTRKTTKKTATTPAAKSSKTDAAASPMKSKAVKREAAPKVVRRPEPTPISDDQRRAMIAEAAYLRAEARGFLPGGEVADWIAAEREVDTRLGR